MSKTGLGTILVLVALIAMLIGAIAFMVVGWGAPEGGSPMSTAGWVAMAFGVIVTLVLGIGLMALMFYSSRRGHD